MRCVMCVLLKREKKFFRPRRKLSEERDDLVGSLVTSCRPPGWPQRRLDDGTLNASDMVQGADASQWTTDAAN